jgi:hypothetical protein
MPRSRMGVRCQRSVVGQGLGNRGKDLVAVTLQAPGAEALDSRKLLQRDGRPRGDGLRRMR